MSKLIIQSKGAAGEYAKYSMSFYEGCTEKKCTYCYMAAMNNRFGKYFGVAKLKEWLKDESNAFEIFKKEVKKMVPELKQHGLFFNFSSDPFLPQSINLNVKAFYFLELYKIPVYVLTKQTLWVNRFIDESVYSFGIPENVIVGFTLTGCDDKEPGAAKNIDRVIAMTKLHNAGFKTFGSFEPVIEFSKTLAMIKLSYGCCLLFKIGLLSGKKYEYNELMDFMSTVQSILYDKPIYWKDSLLKQAGIDRKDLPKNCVTKDFKL